MFKKKNDTTPERNAPRRMRQPTLDRSMGTSVFSYHANRSAQIRPGAPRRQEPAPEAPAKRAKRNMRDLLFKRSRITVIVAVCAVAVFVNIFLVRTPQLTVISDDKSKVFLQDRNVYQAAADRELHKSLTSANKLTINTAGIEASLRQQFPELASVHVSVPFVGNKISVAIEPAMPQLLLSAGTQVYVLDPAGRAVIPASQAPHIEKVGLPVVTDESSLPLSVGKPALPSTSVAFITEVVTQLRAKKIDIASLTLPAGNSELHVRITGVPYYVKFNLLGNAREEAGTYLAVKGQLDREKKTPNTYIDVRVEERAYYK